MRVAGQTTAPSERIAHRTPAVAVALMLAAAAPAAATRRPDLVEIETPVLHVIEPVRQPPEHWTYAFSWSGFLKVGEIDITAGERVDEAGAHTIDVFIRGGTGTFMDLFWRYRLNGEGVVHLDPFRPGKFVVRESIRRWPKTTRVEFDGDGMVHTFRAKKGIVREYTFNVTNTYELVSMVYLLLNQDLAVGQHYRVDTLAGTTRYLLDLTVTQRETIDVADAERPAFKVRVTSQDLTEPEDTDKHSHTDIWVSAERPRRLLKAVSDVWFGTVRFELLRIGQPRAWPQPPPPIDLGVEQRWRGGPEEADSDSAARRRVPELRPQPEQPPAAD